LQVRNGRYLQECKEIVQITGVSDASTDSPFRKKLSEIGRRIAREDIWDDVTIAVQDIYFNVMRLV
jgi:hypothetical protein